ncbi:F-box/LRR-repeat protein At3g48880-like [Cornus florida]|uniref:F-box/LRR-repeat protein At3g48880-like n=1 Tax=Cornus florida TaxID=4283 RepID=UPI00289711F8|nr:F-box/LRR-repeat protein At3g48880-like [Cornus florida]
MEELNMDCLVNVLGKVGMESLLFDVPLVCKSWHNATRNPLCWHHLDFPNSFKSRLGSERFNATELIKFAVNRSGEFAVSLSLPYYFTADALDCLTEGCPGLKFLTLPSISWEGITPCLPRAIGKWKNLETLRLRGTADMEPILTQVSLHCKNFVDLGFLKGDIDEDESVFIVDLLPNIKYLDLRKTCVEREALLRILKGCKKLVHLDVSYCQGFEVDDEILNLASRIPTFMYEGAMVPDEEDLSDGYDITNFPIILYTSSRVSDDGTTLSDIEDRIKEWHIADNA